MRLNNIVILGDIFYVLLQNVVYALGTRSTSTGVHPFDLLSSETSNQLLFAISTTPPQMVNGRPLVYLVECSLRLVASSISNKTPTD